MPDPEHSKLGEWMLGIASTLGVSGLVAGIRTWAKANRLEEQVKAHDRVFESHDRLIEKVTDACTETQKQVAGMTGEIRAMRETTQTELGAIRQTTAAELRAIHRSIRERDEGD